MTRIKLVGLAVLAVLAVAALTATASSAQLPNYLPVATAAEPTEFTATSGKTEFISSGLTLTSEKSKGTGVVNSEMDGTFDFLFEKVLFLGILCTGLEDKESGSVLALGNTNLRYALNSKKEKIVVVAFLLKPVHFSCAGTLAVVTGCVAGEVTPVKKATKELVIKLETKEKDNTIVKIFNLAGTAEEPCELKSSTNEGTVGLAAQKQEAKVTGFKNKKGAVEPEIMS